MTNRPVDCRPARIQRRFRVLLFLLVLPACSSASEAPPAVQHGCPEFPKWSYDSGHLFPADGSLLRPEDGAALADGRLVVADEAVGLRLIESDGSNRPFGDFASVGYSHDPPDFPGGANGVMVDTDGSHLLVADIFAGRIYRVDIATESVTVLYDHPFGINALARDQTGAIWFTQSTDNTPEEGAAGIFGDIDKALPTGALFRLPGSGADMADAAELIVEGLYFANGLAFDGAQQHLYVNELMLDRVLQYRVDVEAGTVSDRTVHATILTPDNLAMDADDNLWVASPISNSVFVVDGRCGSVHRVFHAPSEGNTRLSDEWVRRSHLGEGRREIFIPEIGEPLPGAITGIFFSADGRTTYFSGLGNALLRYSSDE